MAHITQTPVSASQFMGAPIIYEVTSAAAGAGGNISFHRVKLHVTVSAPGVPDTEYERSEPVSGASSQRVEFDIAPCFRAAADLYGYEPVREQRIFPLFSAYIEARDVWVSDGVLIDPAPSNASIDSASYSALLGTLTDYERHHAEITATPTRKPATGELVCAGDKVVYATSLEGTSALASEVTYIFENKRGDLTLGNGHHVYVVDPDRRSRQFQFVNTRGAIESIRAWGMVGSEKMVYEKQEHVISRFERLSQFSRTLVRKYLKPAELRLTSGPVSYEWARWWAYEFGTSSHHWMLDADGTTWLPVNVTIDESTTVIDRTKTDLCHIDFTVQPDLRGGLW